MRQALGISSNNEPYLLDFLNQQKWASAYQKNQQGQNTFVLNNTASTVPLTLPSTSIFNIRRRENAMSQTRITRTPIYVSLSETRIRQIENLVDGWSNETRRFVLRRLHQYLNRIARRRIVFATGCNVSSKRINANSNDCRIRACSTTGTSALKLPAHRTPLPPGIISSPGTRFPGSPLPDLPA